MINAVNLAKSRTNFRSKPDGEKDSQVETRILPNTLKTRMEQDFQKTSSAFLDYPVKGLKGDINSNFYEFLTMGIVPYLVGSGMFMYSFNAVNKHLEPNSRAKASKFGSKMALGVVLYGVMKTLSKHFVTKPVKLMTGVDTEMPYENIVYQLPKDAGENALVEVLHQQRTVFDSKEFYRKDLLKRDYYDKVAKKLGMGENLNDSISETSPIIQNIVATSGTAKSLSSYCWAGIGVALAVQDSWDSFFNAIKNRTPRKKIENDFIANTKEYFKNAYKNTKNVSKEFVKSFVGASKLLWNGNPSYKGWMKHAGKGFVISAALLTTFLTANTIIRAKNMAKNKNINTIDKNRESTVI